MKKIASRKLDYDRMDSGSFYGSYTNMSWHPNNKEIFISYGGGIHAVNVITSKTKIKFSAKRQIKDNSF